jgi:hypothetical protein
MINDPKTNRVLTVLAVAFAVLAFAFLGNLWGRAEVREPIPPVDPKFIDPAPSRVSVSEYIRAGGDPSDFDCYLCHERKKPLTLKFNAEGDVILPSEHSDIVMGHGRHKRNNNCFNCHDEVNLELLQTRDGRELKLADSTPLCGSCHGPTYRDWEAGVHGRTSGFWEASLGEADRKGCTSCHDPHTPKFPSREPAPGPNPLHPLFSGAGSHSERSH